MIIPVYFIMKSQKKDWVNAMSNQDWDKLGEDIRRTVQDAIDSRNYNTLNQTITNTVNSAMSTVEKSLHDAGDAVNKTAQNLKFQNYKRTNRDAYRYQSRSAKAEPPIYSNYQTAGTDRSLQRNRKKGDMPAAAHPELFIKTSGFKAAGLVMVIAGYTVGIAMLLLLVLLVAGIMLTPDLFSAGLTVFAVFTGILILASACLAGIGTSLTGKVKRYRLYITELDSRDYCEVKELAQKLNKPNKYVIKDIEKMIKRFWFLQGHFDSQKTCLIASNKAFEQYNELMKHMEQEKQQEKEAKEKQEKEQQRLDPKVQEVISAGGAYIKKIRECNDAIPGEEISAKISRMEVLIDRIFERVQQEPESVSDIRRLMDYYLPTTVKLLEAYQELDTMPVQGDNIISSKREIEKTLDTLNLAFEKLLDSLFQDTAWSVSADISVLNTMLAQEGLTKDDFKNE